MRMRTRAFLAALVAIAILSITPQGFSEDIADKRCDELFTALRDGNFKEATSHFDGRMAAGLTPERLAQVWAQATAGSGKLVKWEIVKRGQVVGVESRKVELTFEHENRLEASVAVSPITDNISSFYLRPIESRGANTPAPYADASKFHAIDVTVGAAPWTLPGTLTVPAGPGRFPAVVLLAGSGPSGRNENVGANSIFRDIAEGLSSRGVAVLRYDKRTFAYKNLDPQKVTVDQEVIEDGVAAVNLLRTRPEVAADRIFIVGHSLGAQLAPEVAKRAFPVAGVVMLAPPGRKLEQMIVQQWRYLGQASPHEMAELERQANQISAHKMPPAQSFQSVPASYYYDLDARDEIAIAKGLDVPILILHGGRDYQVLDEDIRRWQDGLKGRANVRVETFPALNHLFIAGTGKPGLAEYGTPGHVDPAAIAAIANFVGAPAANSPHP